MWLGAKRTADMINGIERPIIPLSKKIVDGIMESESALKTPFFLKQIIHIRQYSATNITFTIRYTANASSDHQPYQVPGI